MLKSRPHDWLWGRDMIRSARNKKVGKPLQKNGSTYLVVSEVSPTEDWETDETVYAVELWGTEVVRFYPNGVVSASLNGWNTITTKARIKRYSCMQIGRCRNGSFMASLLGQGWLGTEDTWFFRRGDRLIFTDGCFVPYLISSPVRRRIPKRRDPLVRPLPGDAFRNESGDWIYRRVFIFGWPPFRLDPYFGDHPDDRTLICTDEGIESKVMPGDLELLAESHSGGFYSINRYLWERPAGT